MDTLHKAFEPQQISPTGTIVFGADHNADWQSKRLKAALSEFGDLVDVLAFEPALDNYVDVSARVCTLTLSHSGIGVIVCGTGIGVSIVANKHRGIYAARCVTPVDAKDCKVINNANVLCLSAKTAVAQNVEIISEFFATRFEVIDRRMDRVRRIAQVESRNFRPSRAPVKIAFIWRCVDRDMAVTTEQLSTTGAFLSVNPDLFPEGTLDLTLSERGLFTAQARVVRREPSGVAVEFIDGQEEFFSAVSRILASYCTLTDDERCQ
ncbi:MAG TPA: RpiB/LacA/LacB family sugar-phosphate isomerase [Acidobacteriaceae bacterium]|jgi:ribose 5-phosphate isomerase B